MHVSELWVPVQSLARSNISAATVDSYGIRCMFSVKRSDNVSGTYSEKAKSTQAAPPGQFMG